MILEKCLPGPVGGVCGILRGSAWLALALAILALEQQARAQPISRYGSFEAAVTNSRSYANPFTGTVLTAVFTSPSARQVTIEGFHRP